MLYVSRVSSASGGHAAEEHLPGNLRRIREHRGMSQSALAAAMSERGWPWHQQTVYKIENGKQMPGLGEVTDLADILRITVDRLTWTGPEVNAAELVSHAIGNLREAWNEVADAVARLHAATAGAKHTLAESEESPYRRVQDARRGLEEEMAGATLKAAVAEGTARWNEEAHG